MQDRLTVALETLREELIEDAHDFEVLLGASVQGIRPAQLQRGGFAVDDAYGCPQPLAEEAGEETGWATC